MKKRDRRRKEDQDDIDYAELRRKIAEVAKLELPKYAHNIPGKAELKMRYFGRK